MGLFITFEGIEGCGKTTQAKLTTQYLRERGYPVLLTAEPGGTPAGKHIRALLLGSEHLRLHAEAELLLFATDRAQHVREVVAPAMEQKRIVICDRYTDATLAYQGFGRGLDREVIARVNASLRVTFIPT